MNKMMMALAIFGLAIFGLAIVDMEEADASMGSSDNPVSSVSTSISSFVSTYSDRTVYIANGGSFSMTSGSGYTAVYGGGGISVSNGSFTGTVTGSTSLTYSYEGSYGQIRVNAVDPPKYTVTYSAGSGGTATGYIYNGTTKSYFQSGQEFSSGQRVYLLATANSGYAFTNWTSGGSEVSDDETYSFTLSGNVSVKANFHSTITRYYVDYSANNSSYGSVSAYTYTDGIKSYFQSGTRLNSGTVAYFQANPATGYEFVNWTMNNRQVSTNTTYSYTVNQTNTEYELKANFRAIQSYTVTFAANDSTYGSVYGYTMNGNVKSYFQSGTSLVSGTQIYVEAAAATGYNFLNWTSGGSEVSTNTTYSFALSGNVSLTANFQESVDGTVTFAANDSTYGSVYGYTMNGNVKSYFQSGTGIPEGTTVYVEASARTGYSFINWTSGGSQVSTNLIYNFTMPATDYSIMANFEALPTYTVSFEANNSEYGSVFGYFYNEGTKIFFQSGADVGEGAVVYIQASARTGYSFINWTSGGSQVSNDAIYSFTVEGRNYSFTANFEIKAAGTTYWSNDLYNGTVSIAFQMNTMGSKSHTMNIPLFTGTVNDRNETTWTDSGYSLKITVEFPATITAKIYNGGELIDSKTGSYGYWSTFVLDLQLSTGMISFVPIDTFSFQDFTNYKTMESSRQTVFSWNEPENATAFSIEHTDSGSGAPVRFSVVETMTFLNTFGVVLQNPSLNVQDYFPQYEKVRVNLFSFAVYGETITINGKTWELNGSEMTVTFTTDDDGVNHYAEPGSEGSESKTLTLSNISITWDGESCSLTFNDDNFTIDIGSYSTGSKTFSFTGLWYFTATIAEPYTATTTEVTGEWDSILNVDASTVILLFLGIITAAGLFCHVKFKLKWLDIAILVIGLIVAFTLLG